MTGFELADLTGVIGGGPSKPLPIRPDAIISPDRPPLTKRHAPTGSTAYRSATPTATHSSPTNPEEPNHCLAASAKRVESCGYS